MIRGSQKRMIVVRTRDSRVFEEAYFVMRRGAVGTGGGERDTDEMDMLFEANRILESSLARAKGGAVPSPGVLPPRQRLSRQLIWFLSGLVSGGGLVGLLWFLL